MNLTQVESFVAPATNAGLPWACCFHRTFHYGISRTWRWSIGKKGYVEKRVRCLNFLGRKGNIYKIYLDKTYRVTRWVGKMAKSRTAGLRIGFPMMLNVVDLDEARKWHSVRMMLGGLVGLRARCWMGWMVRMYYPSQWVNSPNPHLHASFLIL